MSLHTCTFTECPQAAKACFNTDNTASTSGSASDWLMLAQGLSTASATGGVVTHCEGGGPAEHRGGVATPIVGGANGLWIGGVMGGVPVPGTALLFRRFLCVERAI